MYLYYDFIGYGFVIIATIITLSAEFYINNRYKKYKDVDVDSELTGVEVARKILDSNGLKDVYVTEVKGVLTDHYDPIRKVVRLSSRNFHDSSIAAVSVAAHECGHAIQHKEGYVFIKIRGFLVPFVNFASKFGYIAIMIGLIFGFLNFAWGGFALLLIILLFQLVTLPTEFDASKRGKQELKKLGIVDSSELVKCNDMLRAAALTYVAGLASTILELIRTALIISSNDD